MSDIDTGTPAAEPADDIRSMLNDAIDETETPATAASEADAATEADAKPPARARGADGKFAAAEGADQAAAAAVEGQAAAGADDGATAAATTEQKAVVAEPPANWSDAHKAMFKTLPEAGQSFLMGRYKDMEADYTRKTQAVAALRAEYEPVDQMFAQHRHALQQAGLTPGKIIQAWGQVERDLTEGRGIDIIKGIVDQPAYKIDKAKLAAVLGLTAQAGAPVGEQHGTAVASNGAVVELPAAVRAELDQFRQRFAQQDQQEQDRQNQAHEARLAESNSRIETFLAEKDASGAPAYPHFTTLERDMVVLATAAHAAGQPVPALKDLYEQAAWANPSTRAEMLAAQQSSATKKAQDDARAKAAAARKAGSSVTGAPATGQPLKPASGDLSLRQLLEKNAADADV